MERRRRVAARTQKKELRANKEAANDSPASPQSLASSVPSPVPANIDDGCGDNNTAPAAPPNPPSSTLFEDPLEEQQGQQRDHGDDPDDPDDPGATEPKQRRRKVTRNYPCPVCARNFMSRQMLLNHEGIHENPRPFLCADCPKGYPTEYLLMRHERKHFRSRPYHCPDCPRKFLWKTYLRRHVRDLHSGVKAFSCDVCGESFHFAISAYTHKKKAHTEQGRKSARLK